MNNVHKIHVTSIGYLHEELKGEVPLSIAIGNGNSRASWNNAYWKMEKRLG